MSHKRKGRIPGPPKSTIPRPTSERDMAQICGYTLITEEKIPKILLNEQRNKFRTHFVDGWENVTFCKCDGINDKCDSDVCENYHFRLACPKKCIVDCKNKPWYDSFTWVLGTKTYLFYNEQKGYGIKAHQDIKMGTWISAYVGVVTKLTTDIPNEAHPYLFWLADVNQCINPYFQGNGSSIINCSCSPNCIAIKYMVEGRYSVAIRATQDIQEDEELTLDYGFFSFVGESFRKCVCDKPNCRQTIEKIRKQSNKRKESHLLSETVTDEQRGAKDSVLSSVAEEQQDSVVSPLSSVTMEECQISPHSSVADEQQVSVVPLLSSVTMDDSHKSPLPSGTVENMHPIHSEGSNVSASVEVQVCNVQNSKNCPGPVTNVNLNQAEPYPFPLLFASTDPSIQLLIYQPTTTKIRPLNYKENFVFDPLCVAYFLTCMEVGKGVGLGSGRVVECFKNKNNQWYYTVITVVKNCKPMIYNVPRLMLYHYWEDALANYNNRLYSVDDVKRIIGYSSPHYTSRENCMKTQDAVVTDFEKLFQSNQIPEYKGEYRTFAGVHALGASQIRLFSESSQSNSTTLPIIQPTLYVEGEEKVADDEQKVKRDQTPEVIARQYFNVTGLVRIVSHAATEVTLLALARYPAGNRPTYLSVYNTVYADLMMWYVEVGPSFRKFLMYKHFLLAIENEKPGSLSLQWCPLCRTPQNFPHSVQFYRHFNIFHSIVSSCYQCSKCHRNFQIPSEFRNHLKKCHNDLASQLNVTINEYILDAYSDYIRKKGLNNMEHHLIIPGIPNLRVGERTSHESGDSKPVSPLYDMDIEKGIPLGKYAEKHVESKIFEIQKKYTTFDKWDMLITNQIPEPVVAHKMNEWKRKRTTAANVVPTTAANVVPTTAANVVITTAANVVPTTAANVVPTTAAEVVPTTAAEVVPTTASNVVPTTDSSQATGIKPQRGNEFRWLAKSTRFTKIRHSTPKFGRLKMKKSKRSVTATATSEISPQPRKRAKNREKYFALSPSRESSDEEDEAQNLHEPPSADENDVIHEGELDESRNTAEPMDEDIVNENTNSDDGAVGKEKDFDDGNGNKDANTDEVSPKADCLRDNEQKTDYSDSDDSSEQETIVPKSTLGFSKPRCVPGGDSSDEDSENYN